MRVLKYTTKHLECFSCLDEKQQPHYQIFEKENAETPIAIYIDKKHMKLADRFPRPEYTYKYFKEMCEIIQTLMQLDPAPQSGLEL